MWVQNQRSHNALSHIGPHMSAEIPRRGNAVTRWLGRVVLLLMGWTIVGQLPNEPKGIIIGVPHTSNWDFFLAMAFMLSNGMRFNWLMKKEAFFFPFGGFLRFMGGVPIDRSRRTNTTQQLVDWFQDHDKAWIAIAPEGTRKNVEHYTKGYLRIAHAVGIPVIMTGLYEPSREIRIDNSLVLTGDVDIDNTMVKAYVDANFKGVRSPKT